jgi:hypothetical protein
VKKILLLFLLVITILFIGGGCSMNSEEKYIAVYGRDGTHISNIQLSKWNITRKVFDLDVSNFEGSCDDDITSGLIFVMNDKYGTKEYSGFMKSIIQDKKTGHVTFKGEDLRSIWDTEVLLDFTPFNHRLDYALDDMFDFVKDAVIAQASSLYTINVTIPTNSTTTEAVGRFDGTYSYTNASEFLKVYLAYYNYYLSADYDIANKEIEFEFIAATTTRTLRLDDFLFTQTLSEVKTNHTVARIKSDINLQPIKTWVYCSEAYWDSLDADMKSSELEVESVFGIPLDPETLPDGYAFRGSNQVPEDTYYYWKVAKVEHVWQRFHPIYADPSGADYWNAYDSGSRLSASYSTTPYVGHPELDPNDYDLGVPIKITYPFGTEYYKVILNTQELSDTVQQTHYYLGLDNEIHIDSILESNQIYPVKTKYFEDEYFAKAQFNALWELVNSRYNENVILDKVNAPVDITTYNLYDMITVYDSNGDSKELPVSEIRWTQDSYKVKLGFKKERFTDIVKDATGTKSSGAIQMKNPFKLIRDVGRLGNLSDTK